jgi:hypothetical protein
MAGTRIGGFPVRAPVRSATYKETLEEAFSRAQTSLTYADYGSGGPSGGSPGSPVAKPA